MVRKNFLKCQKAIKDGKTLKEYLKSNDVTTLLPTEYTEVDLKANLLEAAKTAFGKAGIYNDGKEDRGVLVQPKDDEIKRSKTLEVNVALKLILSKSR